MKTPHIALLALDIMDAMGIRYRVMGGPSACCGVLQFGAGDLATSGRDRLSHHRPPGRRRPARAVLVPDLPGPTGRDRRAGRKADLDMTPFVRFLAERLDALRPLLRHRVEKRVACTSIPAMRGFRRLLRRSCARSPVWISLISSSLGLATCATSSRPLPAFKRDVHRSQLQAAADAGVTTLAGIYHACHRELCSHERDWPFEVVNFLELVGESMGWSVPTCSSGSRSCRTSMRSCRTRRR